MAPEQVSKVKTRWIWTLRKDELLEITGEFNLDSTGTVEALRKRLYEYTTSNVSETTRDRLSELAEVYDRSSSSDLQATPNYQSLQTAEEGPTTSNKLRTETQQVLTDNEERIIPLQQPSYRSQTVVNDFHQRKGLTPMELMDKARQWSVKFDGVRDPLLFVERIEQLATAYDICTDMLPRAMPELLKDRAALWYCYADQSWNSWEEFKEEFLTYFLEARYK